MAERLKVLEITRQSESGCISCEGRDWLITLVLIRPLTAVFVMRDVEGLRLVLCFYLTASRDR